MAEARKDVIVKKGDVQKMPARVMTPFDDMERMFDDFFGRSWMRPFQWSRPAVSDLATLAVPKVDVVDRDDEVYVAMEVPGVEKDDIEISVAGNVLTVRGKTNREEKEEKGDYYRCEIAHGAFSRTLALPSEVDDTKAKASMKDGVLELTLPKMEKAKRHAIRVN